MEVPQSEGGKKWVDKKRLPQLEGKHRVWTKEIEGEEQMSRDDKISMATYRLGKEALISILLKSLFAFS